MDDFFHGWRRKLGVVTLLMALVLMGGWLRSFSATDEIQIGIINQCLQEVRTSWGELHWASWKDRPISLRWTNWPAQQPSVHRKHFSEWLVRHEVRQSNADNITRLGQVVIFPYWSITIPLTLISAFLLLSKPRKSTQMKTLGLISETVA